jgi:CRP/FNR family transcriptional regulator
MKENSMLWHFENFNIIKCLSEDEKKAVIILSNMKAYHKKQIIYLPEDASDTLFFLKSGKVKISKYSESGKEMILSILGPGEIFGEISISTAQKRNEVAEVMEDALLCSIKVDDLNSIIADKPKFTLQIVKVLDERIKKIEKRLESLYFKTVPERIKEFLYELAVENKNYHEGQEIELDFSLTHEEIAKVTATNRQSVTSTLNQLESQNIIQYSRKKLIIKDLNALILHQIH